MNTRMKKKEQKEKTQIHNKKSKTEPKREIGYKGKDNIMKIFFYFQEIKLIYFISKF